MCDVDTVKLTLTSCDSTRPMCDDSDSDHAPDATRRTPEAETLSDVYVSGDTFQKNMIGVADGGTCSVGYNDIYFLRKSLRFEKIATRLKSLLFVPPALASFHPRHRAASGRAWWSTDLARCVSALVRPTGARRSAHSQNPTSTLFHALHT